MSNRTEPRNVILFAAEDDAADTIRPRFEMAGGDPSKLFIVDGIIRRDRNGKSVSLGIDLGQLPAIEAVIREKNPALVIFDPFQSFVGARVDTHRANEVSPVLNGLAQLASKYGCAVLLIRHLSKGGNGGSASYRGLGSISITGVARSVLLAGRNPHPATLDEAVMSRLHLDDIHQAEANQSRYVLVHSKANLAQKGKAVSYFIHKGKVHFGGNADITADELLSGPHNGSRPRVRASDFLKEKLASGPVKSADLFTAAELAGIAKPTLHRAMKDLHLLRRPAGFRGPWEVSLPQSKGASLTTVRPETSLREYYPQDNVPVRTSTESE